MTHLIQRMSGDLDRASLRGLLNYCNRKVTDLINRMPPVNPK